MPDELFPRPDFGPLRERVVRLRTFRGWDQPTLAERTGTNQTLISQVERGRRDPAPELLSSLADAFGCTVGYLTAAHPLSPPTDPWLRAYADASRKDTARRVAAAGTAAEYIHALGLKRFPDLVSDLTDDVELPGFTVEPGDMEEIEDLAAETRELLEIGESEVIPNMIRAAERLGVTVLPLESELGRHMGMSLHADDWPMLFVAKAGIPGDRQRFTVAHEVGHLVLHSGFPPPRTVEAANLMEHQANRFAAAFLTPADAVVETLEELGGRVTLSILADVKQRWGVAIKMLVGRYRSLGIIDDDQARSLYKQISGRRWTKVEPVEVPTEEAHWFAHRIREAAGTTDLHAAVSELANQVGGNGEDLLAFADWSDTLAAPVTELADWRRER